MKGVRGRDVIGPQLKIGVRVRGSAVKLPEVAGVFLGKIKLEVPGERHVISFLLHCVIFNLLASLEHYQLTSTLYENLISTRRWGGRSISRSEGARRRRAGFRPPRSSRRWSGRRCGRWCDDLTSEDADLMAEFFETYEDGEIDLITDYLFDVYGDDESDSSQDYDYY